MLSWEEREGARMFTLANSIRHCAGWRVLAAAVRQMENEGINIEKEKANLS